MNKVLDGRNWKYLIAFDNEVYKEVMHHAFCYGHKERQILDYQINFYRKNFTFQQLIKSFKLLKTDEEISEFKSAVYKRKENILYMPVQLKQYYIDLIKQKYNDHREFLMEMLTIACAKSGKKNPMLPVMKKIFGSYLGDIKAKLHYYSRKQLPVAKFKKAGNEEEIKNFVKQKLNMVKNDEVRAAVWGEYDIDSLRIEFNNDVGFGKSISKQFFSGSEDSYIIQTNEKRINEAQLEYGVYRNIYPGRMHLFNQLLTNRDHYCFDSGADFVVNGWSTFSSWHMYPSDYTKYSKVLHGKIAYKLFGGNWQRSLDEIYIFLLSCMSKKEAINYLIELSQYPGRYESYVIGAIATELLIKKKFATNPMGLLDEYKKRNVADFFALFKKNTNKC